MVPSSKMKHQDSHQAQHRLAYSFETASSSIYNTTTQSFMSNFHKKDR